VSGEKGTTDWVADVLAFHRALGAHVGARPGFPAEDVRALRRRLLDEEIEELREADASGDIVELADALADIVYVLVGTAVSHGIDLRPVWDEVHRSNMAKVAGRALGDAKARKPEGWTPPDVAGCLERQGELS
jgi:predicted HAD superfamily Cof-like phosphohydrolase